MNQSWITNSVTFFYLQVLQNSAMILDISVKMKKSLQKTESQKDKKTKSDRKAERQKDKKDRHGEWQKPKRQNQI